MIPRRAVSEFPNDNPELHDGLVWTCAEPCAEAIPTLRLRAVAGALPKVLGPAWAVETAPATLTSAQELVLAAVVVVTEPSAEASPVDEPRVGVEEPVVEKPRADAPPVGVEEPIVEEPVVAAVAPTPACEEPSGDFAAFVAAVSQVALEHGATRAAITARTLLESGSTSRAFDTAALDRAMLDGLAEHGIATPDGRHLTPEFLAVRSAWRGVLDGTLADLSACGSTMLDGWGAEVLVALLNAPRERENLRRALRRHGVAAFGVLAAA